MCDCGRRWSWMCDVTVGHQCVHRVCWMRSVGSWCNHGLCAVCEQSVCCSALCTWNESLQQNGYAVLFVGEGIVVGTGCVCSNGNDDMSAWLDIG